MIRLRFEKFYLMIALQLLLQVLFLVLGICFRPTQNVVSTNFLEIITKVQTTNNWQNFIWCMTNNLSVTFIIFWLNYWTWGIVGTLWGFSNSFMLGAVVRLCVVFNHTVAVVFTVLELVALWYTIALSTYFRFNRSILNKKLKRNLLDNENYKAAKALQNKSILLNFAVIASVLFVAAILETIGLALVQ